MKKLAIVIALLMAVCALPVMLFTAPRAVKAAPAGNVAVGTDTNVSVLQIDPDAPVNPSRPSDTSNGNTYGTGYMPTTPLNNIDIVLPLGNTGSSAISNLRVSLTATNADPAIKASNLVLRIPSLAAGGSESVKFPLRFKEECYNGIYAAVFKCEWLEGGETVEQEITIYFERTNNPEPTETPAPQTGGPSSMPKLMVTSYTVTPEDVLAGGQMSITMNVQNMSAKRSALNIELKVESADGVFLPVNGTNSAYIAKLKPQESSTHTFTFDVKPDATPGPAQLTVTMNYEDAAVSTTTLTSNIAVPVNQPIRLRITDPVTYGDTDESPFTVSLSVYNLGKSSIYNLMADIVGDNVTPNGSYFGGTLEPGGQKNIELSASAVKSGGGENANNGIDTPMIEPRAEDAKGMMRGASGVGVTVATDMAVTEEVIIGGSDGGYYYGDEKTGTSGGTYSGSIVITYEDVMGKQFTEEAPFSITLAGYYPQEDYPVYDPSEDIPAAPDLTWLWITLPCLAVAGLVVFLIIRGKKRKKIIEDELL